MVWRVSDRATFEALRKNARRARSGPVTVAYHRTEDPPVARVAYAVGRRAGGAVVRNRVRRRLRAVVAELSEGLAPGAYLVSAGNEAAEVPFAELRAAVGRAMASASESKPR